MLSAAPTDDHDDMRALARHQERLTAIESELADLDLRHAALVIEHATLTALVKASLRAAA